MGIVNASKVAGTVAFCLLAGPAHAEISFEEAVALIAGGDLQPRRLVDDENSAEARRYVLAADKIHRVSRIDPDRVRAIRDRLVAEAARLDWDIYTQTRLSGEYRDALIGALGAIRDPGLIGFFMDYCRYSLLVSKPLAKLGEAALSAAIRNLEDPAYAEPACMMFTLVQFVKEIKSPDSVYSTGEKHRLLDLIRREGLPAYRSSVFADRERQKTTEPAVASPRPSLEEEWLRDLEDVVAGRSSNLASTTLRVVEHAETSFEEAVALIASGDFQAPRVDDDESLAEARRHGLAADKIRRVSRFDPDRIRAVRDTLVGEVARVDWKDHTEWSFEYKLTLIKALGAIHDPGLTGFFMHNCRHGHFVAKRLAKLGEAALSAAIRNLENPAHADPGHAKPICMMSTLLEFAREIRSPDSVYSTGEKQRLLDLIRQEGLPASRSSAFARWEWKKTFQPALASPRPPAKGIPLNEEWLRELEDLVSEHSPDLTATTSSVPPDGGNPVPGTVEPDGPAQAEISFEEAVALVADSGLQPPGGNDDGSGAEARQYVLAADKILRVSQLDPDRIRAVQDTLVGKVANDESELPYESKYLLINALGAIRDPGLTAFFMDNCRRGKFVAKPLAKLGETALSAAIRNLEDPLQGDPSHADPVCMMFTLIEFAEEIGSPDSVYSSGEKQRLLDLIRREGLPAFRSSAFAQWEWDRVVQPALTSPRPPAKGIPLNEAWLRHFERLVSAVVP